MTALALTIEAVKKHGPCSDDFNRVAKLLPKRRKITAAQARKYGCSYNDIIWIANEIARNSDEIKRRLTAYLNDNAKAVLHIFERAAPDDSRVRDCIQATDDFLAGKISEGDWREAAWAAWAARAARDAWTALDEWDARDAWNAWDAGDAWYARAARAAFYAWQFDRLIYWLTEENPKPLPMPKKGVPALPEIEALAAKAEQS